MFLYLSVVVALAVLANGVPVPLELVDMTYVQDNDTLHWPWAKKFTMRITDNGTQPEGYWLQMDEFTASSHVGTHMDAPAHFAEGGWTVDQVPLHRLVAEAAVVDISARASQDSDALVTPEDLQAWESATGRTLDHTVVMIRSGWGSRWGNREAYTGTPELDETKLHFPGMSREGAQWLVDNRDIYGLGTETLSLDAGPDKVFIAHSILQARNIYGLENVANVDKLPMAGATLYVMPMKMGRGSGAPTRILAVFPKHLKPT